MYLKSGARSPILRNSCAEYLGCPLHSATSCAASHLVLMRTYEKTVIGRTIRPIAINTSAMVSVPNISLISKRSKRMTMTDAQKRNVESLLLGRNCMPMRRRGWRIRHGPTSQYHVCIDQRGCYPTCRTRCEWIVKITNKVATMQWHQV